ncbi:hypothetical protein [Pseudanabaena sp. 'Roaring Creek']|nr:hypothetical protein [Pseudanabaena sp. 'Roaring Creek']
MELTLCFSYKNKLADRDFKVRSWERSRMCGIAAHRYSSFAKKYS